MADDRLPYTALIDANHFLDAEEVRVDPDGREVKRQRVADPRAHAEIVRLRTELVAAVEAGADPRTPSGLLFGEAVAVAPGASAVLVRQIATDGFRIIGMIATGKGDGKFVISVGGQPVLVARIHATKRDAQVYLPIPYPVPMGAEVTLTAHSETDQTTSYEATLVTA